jgi:hypothetical protein
MKKHEKEEEAWETPSLEWIHRIRREMRRDRKGRPARPLSRRELEKLAGRYGLKVAQDGKVGR